MARGGRLTVTLRDDGRFAAIIVAQRGNDLVRLGDVARVEVGPEDERTITHEIFLIYPECFNFSPSSYPISNKLILSDGHCAMRVLSSVYKFRSPLYIAATAASM